MDWECVWRFAATALPCYFESFSHRHDANNYQELEGIRQKLV